MTDWARADINDILREWQQGKLSNFSTADLQRMSTRCCVYIQNNTPDALHAQKSINEDIHRKEAAINEEIRRKESAESERRSMEASSKMHAEASALSREEIAASHHSNRLQDGRFGSRLLLCLCRC
jgi:low affinity Fe/Cu permease